MLEQGDQVAHSDRIVGILCLRSFLGFTPVDWSYQLIPCSSTLLKGALKDRFDDRTIPLSSLTLIGRGLATRAIGMLQR